MQPQGNQLLTSGPIRSNKELAANFRNKKEAQVQESKPKDSQYPKLKEQILGLSYEKQALLQRIRQLQRTNLQLTNKYKFALKKIAELMTAGNQYTNSTTGTESVINESAYPPAAYVPGIQCGMPCPAMTQNLSYLEFPQIVNNFPEPPPIKLCPSYDAQSVSMESRKLYQQQEQDRPDLSRDISISNPSSQLSSPYDHQFDEDHMALAVSREVDAVVINQSNDSFKKMKQIPLAQSKNGTQKLREHSQKQKQIDVLKLLWQVYQNPGNQHRLDLLTEELHSVIDTFKHIRDWDSWML